MTVCSMYIGISIYIGVGIRMGIGVNVRGRNKKNEVKRFEI